MATAGESAIGGRERLLHAARALFPHGTFAEVSVGQVIQQAGVQAPTLYHHFGDKEGLFVAWAVDTLHRLGQRLLKHTADPSDVRSTLVAYARVLIASDVNLAQVRRDAAKMSRADSSERVLNAYFESIFEPLCGAFVMAIARGEILPEPVDRLAHLYIAVANSGSLGTAEPQELASWLADRFLNGVAAGSLMPK